MALLGAARANKGVSLWRSGCGGRNHLLLLHQQAELFERAHEFEVIGAMEKLVAAKIERDAAFYFNRRTRLCALA